MEPEPHSACGKLEQANVVLAAHLHSTIKIRFIGPCLVLALFCLPSLSCVGASVPSPYGYFSNRQNAALTAAALEGNVREIDRLIRDGADSNAVSTNGLPILLWAYLGSSKAGFVALLEHHADPGARVNHRPMGASLPEILINSRDTYWFKQLLAHGLSPDYDLYPPEGDRLIYETINNDRKELTQLLIKQGANLNVKNIGGFTPLMQCVHSMGNPDTAIVLLEAGADWKPVNRMGISVMGDLVKMGERPNIDRTSRWWKNYVALINWLSAHGATIPDRLAAVVR